MKNLTLLSSVFFIFFIFSIMSLNAQEKCGDPKIEQIKQEIQRLRDMARDAKERGDVDKAREFMEKAEQIERELRERRPGKEEMGDIGQKIQRLRDMARDAKERGDVNKAREFMEQAEQIERESRERRPGNEYETQELEEIKKHDPARFEEINQVKKLEQESFQIAEAYQRERDMGKREEIKQRLLEVLNRIFECKMKQHQREIEKLSQEVDRLKKRIESRFANKNKIIEKRLNELIREKDDWDW